MKRAKRVNELSTVANRRGGLCGCGCGQVTAVIKRSNATRGLVAGEHREFLKGHQFRARGVPPEGYIVDEKTGCWNWCLGLNTSGYAQTRHDGRLVLVHRRNYEEKYGPIPAGMVPDHLCRNRRCVNPDHLEIVTPLENHRRGASPKLTPDQVAEIRASSEPHRVLAKRYGISRSAVSLVKEGKTYRSLPHRNAKRRPAGKAVAQRMAVMVRSGGQCEFEVFRQLDGYLGPIFTRCFRQGSETAHIVRRVKCGDAIYDPDVALFGCETCHDVFDGRRKGDKVRVPAEAFARCVAAIQRVEAARKNAGKAVVALPPGDAAA